MHSRRSFLAASGVSAAMSGSAIGAADRVRMAVIGSGTRGSYMSGVLAGNADCEFVAVCDVYKPNRERTAAKLPGTPEMYVDYRRVLERKDIDAVLIATPDHWHGPMLIEACQAGKDAYCEKPLTNSIEMGWKMIDAVRRHRRVVQVGLQQRSWAHFQECAKLVQSGMFGKIYHAGLAWEGNYTRPAQQPENPPEDLDWELFQGPAERRPYTRARQRGWRAFYDYAGGLLTDQGVHVADVALWYLSAREPRTVSGSGQYVNVECPARDQLPDSFIVSWQYDNFVMSFTNAHMPHPEYPIQGNYFYGPLGALHVNRVGYTYKPIPRRGPDGKPEPPAFEPVNVGFRYVGGPSDQAHARNFLDCVKSREQPITGVETGFYSTLPTLLGVLALRYERMYQWNGKEAKPV